MLFSVTGIVVTKSDVAPNHPLTNPPLPTNIGLNLWQVSVDSKHNSFLAFGPCQFLLLPMIRSPFLSLASSKKHSQKVKLLAMIHSGDWTQVSSTAELSQVALQVDTGPERRNCLKIDHGIMNEDRITSIPINWEI